MILSFTSIPPRFPFLGRVIQQLEKQTVRPDAVELYFDMNHNGGSYDASDRQWIKVVSSTNIWQKVGAGTGTVTSTSKVVSTSKLITGGYSVEFAIPWTTLGVKPSTKTLYGFDIAFDDCDGTASRTNQTMWVGDGNDYQNLSNVGTLQLAPDSAFTGLPETKDIQNQSISVYPNPAQSSFVVSSLTQSEKKVALIDIYGRDLKLEVGDGKLTFDCSMYNSGVYFLRIETNHQIITKSIIIVK